jgi:hypothetical protein
MMRLTSLAIAAVTAAGVSVGPARAAWEEHTYHDLGIAKEFPNPPARTTGTYTAPVAGTAPATILSVSQDNIDYKMTVVDLPTKQEFGAAIMGECTHFAEQEGEVLANMTNRVEPGARAVYGRLVSVNLRNNAGRRQTACLYTKGKLYKIEATVHPEHGQPNSSQAIRFTNSMSFNLEQPYGAAGGGGGGN